MLQDILLLGHDKFVLDIGGKLPGGYHGGGTVREGPGGGVVGAGS